MLRGFDGVWRWQTSKGAVWLYQCVMNWGASSQGALNQVFALDGRQKPGTVIDLLARVEGLLGDNSISIDAAVQRGRLIANLYLERFLVLAARAHRTIAVYDLDTGKTLLLISDAPQAELIEDVVLTADVRHAVQLNRDGQFFVHELASGRTVLQGRQVDDEIIIFSPEGYYWSSYEGAHFVQLRFPGLPGAHTFQQFASMLDRPDFIKARLIGAAASLPVPELSAPPQITVGLDPVSGNGAQHRLRITATSVRQLARLLVYRDGHRIMDRTITGEQYKGDLTVDTRTGRWLNVVVLDERGLASRAQAIPLKRSARGGGRLHAVLIGIDTYARQSMHLEYARSDAERLGKALESSASRYYTDARITRLLDTQATAVTILDTLRRVVTEAEPQDTILFSFAGHGVKGDEGKLYLTPAEYRTDDVTGTGLAWSEVAKILSSARARVIVFLDACHAGLSGAESASTNDDAVQALLSGARSPMLVFAASKGRQLSHEGGLWNGGLFTHAIVEALQHNREASDLNGNGLVEASELYLALKSIVVRESKGAQTPWLVRQDLIGDFALF
jgi:hypothetical protein